MTCLTIKNFKNRGGLVGDLAQVEAMILAGGLGTRLRSMVSDRPKVLAEVLGRPFLAYLLDQLAASGITRVILCIGYLGEQIRDTFGDAYDTADGAIQISYSQETQLLGTGGALGLAIGLVRSPRVLVMNGDSFCGADLEKFHQFHQQKSAPASIVLTQVADTARYGKVELASDHRVEKFTEKGENKGLGWINGGIYLIESPLLAKIQSDRLNLAEQNFLGVGSQNCSISLEAELFPQWIKQGVYGYHSQGKFLDIGTPESYPLAKALFST
jgi:D-glycero-alpha-D-manno-heptose 1-phosphate guanylyltransferase